MSNTTFPNTTFSNTPTPTNPGTSSCQVIIPDYTVLRQENIKKINDYYGTLLSSYTKDYTEYAKDSVGNANSRANAATVLMPKVKNGNDQIINLSQAMINNVNQDTDLINEQKNELARKMAEIDSIISNISLLKDKDNEMTVLSSAKIDSLNSTTSSAEDMQFTTYVYIGICILLVLIVIGLIIYLVYSNYSSKPTKPNNTNNTNNTNNLYKNIATNNSASNSAKAN
jgi:hypothetical protein